VTPLRRARGCSLFAFLLSRRPEAPIHLREFEPDVTAGDDDQMFRQKIDGHHLP
jgi:hypothetical protein